MRSRAIKAIDAAEGRAPRRRWRSMNFIRERAEAKNNQQLLPGEPRVPSRDGCPQRTPAALRRRRWDGIGAEDDRWREDTGVVTGTRTGGRGKTDSAPSSR